MFLLYNLVIVALSLVLVLAIASAASRPPRHEDEGQRGFAATPATTVSRSARTATPTSNEPASPVLLVRAAGWQ